MIPRRLEDKNRPIRHAGCSQIIARHYRENRYILADKLTLTPYWEAAGASADGSTFEQQVACVFDDCVPAITRCSGFKICLTSRKQRQMSKKLVQTSR
jgi:hypothetical protein